MPKISCIIPAFNEEGTIISVVNSVKNSAIFDEVIVISDGSTDRTPLLLSKQSGIIFINLKENAGKGGAVWHGLQKATGEIIVMLDADLVGIRKHHLEKILSPILENKADVCIGIINHSDKKWMNAVQKAGSILSGQQAFRTELIRDADIKDSRFGVEIALKNHFKEKGARTEKIILEGVKHLFKEEKHGIPKGFLARLKMYKEVIAAMIVALFKF